MAQVGKRVVGVGQRLLVLVLVVLARQTAGALVAQGSELRVSQAVCDESNNGYDQSSRHSVLQKKTYTISFLLRSNCAFFAHDGGQ